MLRRQKTDLVNGKALIELPPKQINIVHCEFDKDESEFYLALEGKIEEVVNKFMKSGDGARKYTTALLLLLRLRQGERMFGWTLLLMTIDFLLYGIACNHPSLVTKDFKADQDAVDPKATKKDNADDDDDLADTLAAKMGGLSVGKECQLCHVECALRSHQSHPVARALTQASY